jgi:hypothetical protein
LFLSTPGFEVTFAFSLYKGIPERALHGIVRNFDGLLFSAVLIELDSSIDY